MNTLIPAAIRCSLMFTGVVALSLAHPASVQAVPTTYRYTGNHFTFVIGKYTTSDFVTAMVTFAGPLAPNMPLTQVFPTAFSFSDGVQTITFLTATTSLFFFATGPTGAITRWYAEALINGIADITTAKTNINRDEAAIFAEGSFGANVNSPGRWQEARGVPDTGSTLSLMTLTLMALGLVARRFKRAAVCVNLSKKTLALLAMSVLSCAVFNQQAQATRIEGHAIFQGIVQLDNDDLAQATSVLTWFDFFGNNPGHCDFMGGSGDFSGGGELATMAQPWIFNPSTPTPALWSARGFTFDLLWARVVTVSSFIEIEGFGIISGNGFDPTFANARFFLRGNGERFQADFIAPDGGSTVSLLGFALLGLAALRRKLRR